MILNLKEPAKIHELKEYDIIFDRYQGPAHIETDVKIRVKSLEDAINLKAKILRHQSIIDDFKIYIMELSEVDGIRDQHRILGDLKAMMDK